MLKALIFDFDGLILDTETPEVLVWQSIYRDHGFELPVDEWAKTIGGYGISNFDAAEHLSLSFAGTAGPCFLEGHVTARVGRDHPCQPDFARCHCPDRAGKGKWVAGCHWLQFPAFMGGCTHQSGSASLHYFDHIICQDDVPPGRSKPNPDIFLKVLENAKCQTR